MNKALGFIVAIIIMVVLSYLVNQNALQVASNTLLCSPAGAKRVIKESTGDSKISYEVFACVEEKK